jgi:hypothetical protein
VRPVEFTARLSVRRQFPLPFYALILMTILTLLILIA